jgi:hypothetical protein
VAVVILLGNASWLYSSASQIADVPFGFYVLATAVLFAIHDRFGPRAGPLAALAGSMVGFAVWTKNEGLLFLTAILVTRLTYAMARQERQGFGKEIRAFSIGFLPPLLVLVAFKLYLAPTNDLVAGQSIDATFGRLRDGGRYEFLARCFAGYVLRIGPGAILLMAGYRFLLGSRTQPGAMGEYQPAFLLVLMLAGYFMTYIVTPRDLLEHVRNSLERLLVQLWPLAVFAFFLVIPTPMEAWCKPGQFFTSGRWLVTRFVRAVFARS